MPLLTNPGNWWKSAVIYELYVDKFAVNFSSLSTKLDYFNHLGVNTLWILPHYPTPGVDDGYDISDYFAVRPDLGTLGDFKNFVLAAHNLNLRVVVDMVLNHTSSEHLWFKESRSSKNNPKRNWYLWADDTSKFSQAFVHFTNVKTSNWIKNDSTGDYYYATFYPEQPDLNWDNPEVFVAMTGVLDFWLDLGVDGFRLDAISRLIKRDGTWCFGLPETHEVVSRLRAHIDSKYPGTLLLAESGGWPDEARQFFGDSDECQMVINFPLAAKMLSSIDNHDMGKVSDLWSHTASIPADCSWGVFLTNHDGVDIFFLSSEEEKAKLIARVGPRSAARLAQICRGNENDILWATKLQFAQPGTPIIYYGNEIGMQNQILTSPPRDDREYVRGPFDWQQALSQMNNPDSLFSRVSQIIRDYKH